MDHAYENWKQGLDPSILDQWPAQEMILVIKDGWSAKDDLAWRQKWNEAGGKEFDGRMIALKNDPVWHRMSYLGKPYPHFDETGHWDVSDVDRMEAEELGLITEDEVLDVKAFFDDPTGPLTRPLTDDDL